MQFPGVFLTSFTIPTGTTTGSRIVIDGVRGALFVYDSSNNLIASIAPGPGFDGSGNHYLQGITSQSIGLFVNLSQGNITMGGITGGIQDTTNASSIFPSPTLGAITVQSGKTGGSTDPVNILLFPGASGTTTGASNIPRIFFIDQLTTSDADALISGSVIKTDKTGTQLFWQTPSYMTGWAGATTWGTFSLGDPLRFRKMVQDDVLIYGLATASAGATANIFTLPSGYHSTTATTFGTALRDSGGTITVVPIAITRSGGVVQTMPTPIAGDQYLFNFTIPLENLF